MDVHSPAGLPPVAQTKGGLTINGEKVDNPSEEDESDEVESEEEEHPQGAEEPSTVQEESPSSQVRQKAPTFPTSPSGIFLPANVLFLFLRWMSRILKNRGKKMERRRAQSQTW